MKKSIILIGLVLALTACAEDQAPPPAPMARNLPPKIMMDVKIINLTDRSIRQPANSPYIDNHFSPTIADAVKQWAGDRLQAVGQNGQAIVVIKEASLTSQILNTSDGIDTWFTRQQGLRYTGHAEVSLEATAAPGFAIAEATATRSVTLPEHPTALERQDAYYSLLNGLMRDLGQNLESSIQAHMSNFIVTPPTYGATSVPTTGMYAGTAMTQPVVVQSSVPATAPTTTLSDASQNYAPAPMQMQAQQLQPPVQVQQLQPPIQMQHVTVEQMQMPLASSVQAAPLGSMDEQAVYNGGAMNAPTVIAPIANTGMGQASYAPWPTQDMAQPQQVVMQQPVVMQQQAMQQPSLTVPHQAVIPLSGPYSP